MSSYSMPVHYLELYELCQFFLLDFSVPDSKAANKAVQCQTEWSWMEDMKQHQMIKSARRLSRASSRSLVSPRKYSQDCSMCVVFAYHLPFSRAPIYFKDSKPTQVQLPHEIVGFGLHSIPLLEYSLFQVCSSNVELLQCTPNVCDVVVFEQGHLL